MKKAVFTAALVLFLFMTGCAGMQEALGKILPGRGSAGEMDEATIVAGLKEALSVGTREAVRFVSAADGYFANAAIKILIPQEMEDIAAKLRQLGLGRQVDEFILTMNRAAEQAAAGGTDIFIDAVKNMTLADARNILHGADDAATRYFETRTRDKLFAAFNPVIKNAMEKVGAIKIFKFLMDSYNKIPFVKKRDFRIEEYVNNKALDGLFYMLAGEEKKIRRDPAARITELLKKVFG